MAVPPAASTGRRCSASRTCRAWAPLLTDKAYLSTHREHHQLWHRYGVRQTGLSPWVVICRGGHVTVDVRELLESATLADPATVRALDALTEEPESVAAGVREALGRVDTDDTDRLVPLLSLAASHLTEAQPFADLLGHADSTVRLVAAKACAARGEARGIPTLVELLEDTGRDRSTRAPVAVWAGASLALARLTGEVLGPPLDADAYTRRRARGRWHELLRSRELTWSAERGEWD